MSKWHILRNAFFIVYFSDWILLGRHLHFFKLAKVDDMELTFLNQVVENPATLLKLFVDKPRKH